MDMVASAMISPHHDEKIVVAPFTSVLLAFTSRLIQMESMTCVGTYFMMMSLMSIMFALVGLRDGGKGGCGGNEGTRSMATQHTMIKYKNDADIIFTIFKIKMNWSTRQKVSDYARRDTKTGYVIQRVCIHLAAPRTGSKSRGQFLLLTGDSSETTVALGYLYRIVSRIIKTKPKGHHGRHTILCGYCTCVHHPLS